MGKRKRSRDESSAPEGPRVRAQDDLLIQLIPELSPQRALCTTAGRGQFAVELARSFPEAQVTLHYLDLYQKNQADELYAADRPAGLETICSADYPEGPFDLIAITFRRRGEVELSLDVIQDAVLRLASGGRLIAAIDQPEDQWLHLELKKYFPKVTRREHKSGTVYLAVNPKPVKKVKDHRGQFTFRDRAHLIHAISRPGVFAHRRLDGGARALINAMEIEPNETILDLGCGSGGLTLAALRRADGVVAFAADSNPRALECVQAGVELNQLGQVTTLLDCDGSTVPESTFDVVAANPPYFSHFRIAAIFLATAWKALKPGGRIYLVTKNSEWFLENMLETFTGIEIIEGKEYAVVTGRKPKARSAARSVKRKVVRPKGRRRDDRHYDE